MGELSRDWDAAANPSAWLSPDERIMWRGRPDPNRLIALRDVPLVLGVIVYFVFFGTVFHSGMGSIAGAVVWALFVAWGVALGVGRLVVQPVLRRRTRYAITNHRVLVVRRDGRIERATPITAPMTVARGRGGRHGALTWGPDLAQVAFGGHSGGPSNGGQGRGSQLRQVLNGLGLTDPPRDRRLGRNVEFLDLLGGDVDSALQAARVARSRLGVTEEPSGSSRVGAPGAVAGRARRRRSGSQSTSERGSAREWIDSRLLRHPYALWSPLPPDEVARRLIDNIGPMSSLNFPQFRRPYLIAGRVTPQQVTLQFAGRGNSSEWRFIGALYATGRGGTQLMGTVGPVPFVPVFGAIWCGIVSLVFVGGVVGVMAALATGHHSLGMLPLVLVPLAMLGFFVGLTEAGFRSAANHWQTTERWLSWLLQPPPGSAGSSGNPVPPGG